LQRNTVRTTTATLHRAIKENASYPNTTTFWLSISSYPLLEHFLFFFFGKRKNIDVERRYVLHNDILHHAWVQ
jgi:hypothetical protein